MSAKKFAANWSKSSAKKSPNVAHNEIENSIAAVDVKEKNYLTEAEMKRFLTAARKGS